jgi:hypothetical protein
MKLILPATAAQCPDGRRGLGQRGRFWGRREVRSGLKVSEVESLEVVVVLPEPLKGQPRHAQQAFAAELLPLVF